VYITAPHHIKPPTFSSEEAAEDDISEGLFIINATWIINQELRT
jgi:hypothetical protein